MAGRGESVHRHLIGFSVAQIVMGHGATMLHKCQRNSSEHCQLASASSISARGILAQALPLRSLSTSDQPGLRVRCWRRRDLFWNLLRLLVRFERKVYFAMSEEQSVQATGFFQTSNPSPQSLCWFDGR